MKVRAVFFEKVNLTNLSLHSIRKKEKAHVKKNEKLQCETNTKDNKRILWTASYMSTNCAYMRNGQNLRIIQSSKTESQRNRKIWID